MSDHADPARNTILFERVIEATPEEVFDAWTQPDQVTLWWDPTGAPLIACAIDLRPRGAFRFVSAGHAPPFEGHYELIDRPARLEFTALGAYGVVTLRAAGPGTRMNVEIRCASAEHFETFLKLGVQTGTGVTLDNLVALLAGRARAAAPGR